MASSAAHVTAGSVVTAMRPSVGPRCSRSDMAICSTSSTCDLRFVAPAGVSPQASHPRHAGACRDIDRGATIATIEMPELDDLVVLCHLLDEQDRIVAESSTRMSGDQRELVEPLREVNCSSLLSGARR